MIKWIPGTHSPFDLMHGVGDYLPPDLGSLWAIGDLAYFVNCMGSDKSEGEVVKHMKWAVILKKKNGEEVFCPTCLLLPPTHKRWPHSRPKPKKSPSPSTFQLDLFG